MKYQKSSTFAVKLIILLLFSSLFEIAAQMLSLNTVARGRSQSAGAIPKAHRVRFAGEYRGNRESGSSSSSMSLSAKENRNQKIQCESCRQHGVSEQEVRALIDQAQNARSFVNVDLHEASVAINSERLNPTRDGVFARVRRLSLRKIAPVAVSSIITVGVMEMKNRTTTTNLSETTEQNNTTTFVANTTKIAEASTITEITTNSEIENPF